MEWTVKKSVLLLGIFVLLAVSYFTYSQRHQFWSVLQETDIIPEPVAPERPEGLEYVVHEKDSFDSLQKVPGKLDVVKGGISSIKEYLDNLQSSVSSMSRRTRIIAGVAMIAAIISAIIVTIVLVVQQHQLRVLQEQQILDQETQTERLADWLEPPEPGVLQKVWNLGYNVYFVVSVFIVFGVLVLFVLSLSVYWDDIIKWLKERNDDLWAFLKWIKETGLQVGTYVKESRVGKFIGESIVGRACTTIRDYVIYCFEGA